MPAWKLWGKYYIISVRLLRLKPAAGRSIALDDPVLSRPFGFVERLVRRRYEFPDRCCVFRARGDPDAHGKVEPVNISDKFGAFDLLPDPFRDECRPAPSGAEKNDGELLPPIPEIGVLTPCRAQDALRDGFQGLIARRMTVGVVDRLEIVHVDHKERQFLTVALKASKILLHEISEMTLRVESGQFISDGDLMKGRVFQGHGDMAFHGRNAAE